MTTLLRQMYSILHVCPVSIIWTDCEQPPPWQSFSRIALSKSFGSECRKVF